MDGSGSDLSSSPGPLCTTCRIPLAEGQSGRCNSCSIAISISDPSEEPASATPPTQSSSVLSADSGWIGFLCTAVSDISAATKTTVSMLGQMVPSAPDEASPPAPVERPTSSKAPFKRPRLAPPVLSPPLSSSPIELLDTDSPGKEDLRDLSGSLRGDRSEGEASDPEEEAAEPEVSPSMSFLVDELISAVRDTFHIKCTPPEQEEEFCFFPVKNVGRSFPVCRDLTQSMSKAWATPEKRFIPPKRLDILYPFPADAVTMWSRAPVVDPPVARLAKHSTLPVADGASLRDPVDRRVEFLAKSAFEAGGSAFRPIFASAWVARAATEWSLRLQRDILAGAQATELQPSLLLIVQATKFLCEAAFDSGALVAQATALSVGIRRALWLKSWAADTASKRSLTALPFLGNRLFGSRLDEIISQATGGKSTLLPQNKPKRPQRSPGARFQTFQNFRRFQAAGASAQQSAQAQGKRPSPKPKQSWRARAQKSGGQQSAASKASST